MNKIGHIRIDRKVIPYCLDGESVTLIPNNVCSRLRPSPIREKEMVKGVTNDNRDVIFLNCRYNDNYLSYQVLIESASNTGMIEDITKFDRICFEGVPVNVLAGPGRAYDSEDSSDISKRMLSLIPKEWDELNYSSDIKIRSNEINISLEYSIWHNKRYIETSLGQAIPQFIIEYKKTQSVKKIAEAYLMAYDFFKFLNFRRNVKFSKISIQRKVNGKYDNIANVIIRSKEIGTYTNTERNSIIIDDIKNNWGLLFKNIVTRRKQKVYDDFYIPENDEENRTVTYESFLSCALSFEVEYNRHYPSKKEENEKYNYIHNIFLDSAVNLNELFTLSQNNRLTKEDFEKYYFDIVNGRVKTKLDSESKTKSREYIGYYNNIVNALSKIDYSLGVKFSKALERNRDILLPIIDRRCHAYGEEFPSDREAGMIFSNLRNEIAHGTPGEIENIHVVLYNVAKALIYTMILRQSGVSDGTIENIVKRLF